MAKLNKRTVKLPQPESVSDFKQRIAIIMRERETGIKYSHVGGPRADACVVREGAPTYGYNRWEKAPTDKDLNG